VAGGAAKRTRIVTLSLCGAYVLSAREALDASAGCVALWRRYLEKKGRIPDQVRKIAKKWKLRGDFVSLRTTYHWESRVLSPPLVKRKRESFVRDGRGVFRG